MTSPARRDSQRSAVGIENQQVHQGLIGDPQCRESGIGIRNHPETESLDLIRESQCRYAGVGIEEPEAESELPVSGAQIRYAGVGIENHLGTATVVNSNGRVLLPKSRHSRLGVLPTRVRNQEGVASYENDMPFGSMSTPVGGQSMTTAHQPFAVSNPVYRDGHRCIDRISGEGIEIHPVHIGQLEDPQCRYSGVGIENHLET